jgi:hypothetical protein
MAGLKRLASLESGWDGRPGPETYLTNLPAQPCKCLADFYRTEIMKHRRCLELQREYYSEVAILQADDALAKLMEQVEYLCQREDACELLAHLLRQFDAVTRLSAWTDAQRLH